jgi:cytochrome P450
MEYAYARCEDRLSAPDFDPSFHDASVAGTVMGHLTKHIPLVLTLMTSLPDSIVVAMSPDMASYFRLQRDVATQVGEIRDGQNDKWKNASHPTIFHEILSSKLPESEKSVPRLAQDGQVTVVAGTLTTAWALSVALFYLLENPTSLRKLKDELRKAIPNPAAITPLSALEQLPYLTGVIQEALRLSYGVSSRLQRISPDEVMIFNDGTKDWAIPAGTPVGMTSTLVHQHPSIYPSPHSFRPERFVENPRLDRYMLSFSKGSRQCIGINLAYAELYLCLSALFRVYGSKDVKDQGDEGWIELYETDLADIEIQGDGMIPLPKVDTKGVRIVVRK